MPDDTLSTEIERIAESAGAAAVALAYHDYETEEEFAHAGDRWFHAASTIKVPILLGLFAAIDAGDLNVDSRVHVRNAFISVGDGRAFRVEPERDAGRDVYSQIGKTMRVRDLARHMIVTSSNLATNIIVELVGIEELRRRIDELGVEGVELLRGVEDEAAFSQEINNRVTAKGLVSALRAIEDGLLTGGSSAGMLEILHDQEFRAGIPAGLPDGARVANKTGEISTVTHDMGLVYLPERKPYALAILTEWDASGGPNRRETIASLSRAVYERLTAGRSDA